MHRLHVFLTLLVDICCAKGFRLYSSLLRLELERRLSSRRLGLCLYQLFVHTSESLLIAVSSTEQVLNLFYLSPLFLLFQLLLHHYIIQELRGSISYIHLFLLGLDLLIFLSHLHQVLLFALLDSLIIHPLVFLYLLKVNHHLFSFFNYHLLLFLFSQHLKLLMILLYFLMERFSLLDLLVFLVLLF